MQVLSLAVAAASSILLPLLCSTPAKAGIVGLHKWFRAAFPTAVIEIQRGDIIETDHLLFDLNQLLHQAALTSPSFSSRKSTASTASHGDEPRVIQALRSILQSTLTRFKVKKSVVFALDGVPPLAKLAVSQRRRQRAANVGLLSACIERSLRGKQIHTDHNSFEAAEASAAVEQGGQDNARQHPSMSPGPQQNSEREREVDLTRPGYSIPSYLLSPGTHFMALVENECTQLIKQLLQTRRFGSLKFFISGPSSYGEGELKLADWINVHLSGRQPRVSESSQSAKPPRPPPAESIVLIGGDADLVVQCLALPLTANLFVYNSQAVTASKSKKVLYSLCAVLKELDRLFPGKSHLVRNDFALLCMLNGNDYLPKVPGFSFSHFVGAYQATRRRPDCVDEALVDADKKSFSWHFFALFLEELDRVSSLANVARQREECLRLAQPTVSQGVCRASPLQIVNQLVAQKTLDFLATDDKEASADKLKWSFLEKDEGFICELEVPPAAASKFNVNAASSRVPMKFVGQARNKKVAQQRAALELLERCCPELVQLVDEGPWNPGRTGNTAENKADCLPADIASFHKAAAKLRATTPSNTLNNLCMAVLHAPPTFCFVTNASVEREESDGLAKKLETIVSAAPTKTQMRKDADNELAMKTSAFKRVDVVAKGKVIFSCPSEEGQMQSKAKLRHAAKGVAFFVAELPFKACSAFLPLN
ncbi:hypothetical protein Efla_004350 [Eimeria flavescens]